MVESLRSILIIFAISMRIHLRANSDAPDEHRLTGVKNKLCVEKQKHNTVPQRK